MKNKLLIWVALVLAASWLAPSCETDMEKAQNAYSASQVVPIVLSTSGPTLALTTKVYDFKITYDRAGSTWEWETDDATIQAVSEDTKTATILFTTIPVNDTALVTVTETTAGGVTSPAKELKIKVDPFCPLPNGLSDLVGSWSGSDEDYTSEITTTLVTGVLKGSAFGVGFIADFWGETVTALGEFTITINDDGTLDIPRQYLFTTDYDGDAYDYEIKGSGTWSNCGTTPAFLIKYDIYYPGDVKGLAAQYSPTYLPHPYLTADITLDEVK